MSEHPVVFRKAAGERDFDAIARLNHRVFAAEIGQHATSADGRLVDKFHHKNTYFVAECRAEIVGMISVHTRPPYSVAARCPDFDKQVPAGASLAEVRLLAVDAAYRGTRVAAGLIAALAHFLEAHDIEFVAISGIVARERMYRRLGFRPLGPALASGQAAYIPMLVGRGDFLRRNRRLVDRL